MNKHFELPSAGAAAKRIETLRRQSDDLACVESVNRIAVRLDAAMEHRSADDWNPPFRIALIGGTGAGKSALFNALIDRPDASPSGETRPTTPAPVVWMHPSDRKWMAGVFGARDYEEVQASQSGLVVVDTPDLDSFRTEHKDIARSVVQEADLIVVVAIPEKYAAFDILREVREWATRKRWFFVLNKADMIARAGEDPEVVREGMLKRLKDIGFDAQDGTHFVVSAIRQDQFEFGRLREAILADRDRKTIDALRSEHFLSWVRHAVEEPLQESIDSLVSSLGDAEDRLNEEVRRIYADALTEHTTNRSIEAVARRKTWLAVPDFVGGPMVIPVWLRCHFSRLRLAYQAGRMSLGRGSVFGLAGALTSAVRAILQGRLPLQKVSVAIASRQSGHLADIERSAERHLEDLGLAMLPSLWERNAEAVSVEESEGEASAEDFAEKKSPWWVRKMLPTWPPSQGAERDPVVEEALADTLDSMAEEAAQKAIRKRDIVLANALPVILGLHIAWRVTYAWFRAEWLPGGFYAMAALLMAISMIPGYLLIGRRVKDSARCPNAEELLKQLSRIPQTEPLRAVRERLADFSRNATVLRSQCDVAIDELRQEVAPAAYGESATLRSQDSAGKPTSE